MLTIALPCSFNNCFFFPTEFILLLFFSLIRLDPTAALDFVWTCFHSPRLWQGRDQKSTAVGSQGTNSVSHTWFNENNLLLFVVNVIYYYFVVYIASSVYWPVNKAMWDISRKKIGKLLHPTKNLVQSWVYFLSLVGGL